MHFVYQLTSTALSVSYHVVLITILYTLVISKLLFSSAVVTCLSCYSSSVTSLSSLQDMESASECMNEDELFREEETEKWLNVPHLHQVSRFPSHDIFQNAALVRSKLCKIGQASYVPSA